MKRKINSLHIGGSVMLVVGIVVLALGLNVKNKYDNMRDLSEMTLSDIQKGVYVKGRINTVVGGFPQGKEKKDDNAYDTVPFDLYTTESMDTEDDANVSYLLAEVGPVGSGEYVCIAVDEFHNFDLFWHIYDNNNSEDAYDLDYYDFEGVVTHTDFDEKIIKKEVSNWNERFIYLTMGKRVLGDLDETNVSDCCLKLKDLSTRRYYWLFGLPPTISGIVLLIMGVKGADPGEDDKGKAPGKSASGK